MIEKRRRTKPTLATFARQLRKDMTDAERLLWQAIRNQNLQGFRFRRQHIIDPYIVDFACLDKYCIVELDGGQHQAQVVYDEERTAYLQTRGWHILRFWNNDVLNNLDGVLLTLLETLTSYPHPNLPPKKGKEHYT